MAFHWEILAIVAMIGISVAGALFYGCLCHPKPPFSEEQPSSPVLRFNRYRLPLVEDYE